MTVELLDEPVTVESDVDGVMPWLREMLVPALAERDRSASRLAVTVGMDAVRGIGAGDGVPAPCFSLGEEVVWLPARRAGSAVALDDERVGARYLVRPTRVEIGPLGPRPRLRWAALRVVRELVAARPPGAMQVELHAAGLVCRGRAVLLAGPKAAGKTTTLAHLAASNPCSVLASDRILVCPGASGLRAHPLPAVVSLRPETVARLPHLLGSLEHRAPKHAYLTTAGFARLLGRPVHGPAELGCVAFVVVDPQLDGFVACLLAPGEAESRVGSVSRRERDGSRPPTVFEELLGHTAAPRGDPSLLSRIAGRVPCFEVRVGDRFLEQPGLARDLLVELTRGW